MDTGRLHYWHVLVHFFGRKVLQERHQLHLLQQHLDATALSHATPFVNTLGGVCLVCVERTFGTYFGTLGDSETFSMIPFGIIRQNLTESLTCSKKNHANHHRISQPSNPFSFPFVKISPLSISPPKWRWLTDWIGRVSAPLPATRIVHKIVWESWKQKQRLWSCSKPWSVHPFGLSRWNCEGG